MKTPSFLRLFVLSSLAALSNAVAVELPAALNLALPEGYTHKPAKPGLTVSGVLERADGLAIQYEIGMVPRKGQAVVTGRFKNRAVQVGQGREAKWFRPENVNGQPAYFAYDTKGVLHASFPLDGVNFRVVAPSPAQVESALAVLRTVGFASGNPGRSAVPLSLPLGGGRSPLTVPAGDSPARIVARVQI